MSTLRADYPHGVGARPIAIDKALQPLANLLDPDFLDSRNYPLKYARNESPACEELNPTLKRLHMLSGLRDNWDGYGSKKPKKQALESAENWIKSFYQAALLSGFSWQAPLINADENGHIVFEWWGADPKKITICVSSQDMHLIRIWGEDMNNGMQDEPLPDDFMYWRSLWHWLMNGKLHGVKNIR